MNTINSFIVRTRAKARFIRGRNTGNVGNIYRINPNASAEIGYDYEQVGEYRTTGGAFNLDNGRAVFYGDIPRLTWVLGKEPIPTNFYKYQPSK